MGGEKRVVGLTKNWAGFAEFVKGHPMLAGSIAAFLALAYAGQAFNNYYYIDKEQLVNDPGGFYNWDEIGRFGLIFIKKLFGLSWYNPYLNGILLLVTLWLCAMAAGYLFHSIDHGLAAVPLGIFMLLFLIYPTYVDQFLFQYQAFEVMLAYLFVLVSDWYLVQAVRERDRMAFLVSFPLVILSYGIYQSMVSIQLCLYLGIFLVMTYAGEGEQNSSRSVIIHCILHFAITLAGYVAITVFFWKTEGNYLESQIAWRQQGIITPLRMIYFYFHTLVVSDGVYYTRAYLICCLIGSAALCLLLKRFGVKAVWYLLGLAGVVLSPMSMPVLMGGMIAPRIQMTLPLANGILWLFGMRVLCAEIRKHWGKLVKALAVLCGGILVLMNLAPTMRMFYTRDVIGKADEMKAAAIVEKLEDFPSARVWKPIIFWGHREAMVNPACSGPDWTRASVFLSAYEHEYFFEPEYFYSTYRIIGYLKTLGYDGFFGPTLDMMPSAYEHGAAMQVGAIEEYDEYIIIKIGEE